MSLPKSKNEMGYTRAEMVKICKDRGVNLKKFWQELGINTGLIVDGKFLTYKCDVEKALHALGNIDGKFHMFD